MSLHIALLLLVAVPWPVQDADPIKTLIANLGDESAAVRESALQALIASGSKAIPRLRDALKSRDAEVQQRASCALDELERAEKLLGVMQSRPLATLSFQNAPLAQALREVAEQTGLQFELPADLPSRAITASFTRAPLMQVLDVLSATAQMQWSFEGDGTVSWRKTPPVLRPRSYSGGFRTSLSRIDLYRSWDYQQGHALLWVYLESRLEPGIRPLQSPRFEMTEIRDEAGNELPGDSETQECSPQTCSSNGVGRKSGAVYESSPFTIRLDRSVKKLSKISGRAVFLFPLDQAPLEIKDLSEDSSVTQGDLVFQVSEILTSSLKLTLKGKGNVQNLSHHLDADSLVLIDAEGRKYVRGEDFDVRIDPISVDTVLYGVDFHENICFQPVTLRFLMTGKFFEKVVPFVFQDVLLP